VRHLSPSFFFPFLAFFFPLPGAALPKDRSQVGTTACFIFFSFFFPTFPFYHETLETDGLDSFLFFFLSFSFFFFFLLSLHEGRHEALQLSPLFLLLPSPRFFFLPFPRASTEKGCSSSYVISLLLPPPLRFFFFFFSPRRALKGQT